MPIFPPDPDPLFSQRSLATLLRDQIQRMEDYINQYADELFLQNSPDDWIDTISDDVALPPLVLHVDKGVSHPPVEVTNLRVGVSSVPISGFRYAVEVPYEGASGLFNHQPDTYDLDKPTTHLNSRAYEGSIVINRVATAEITPEQFKAAFDAELAKVQKYIDYQAIQLTPFNATVDDVESRLASLVARLL